MFTAINIEHSLMHPAFSHALMKFKRFLWNMRSCSIARITSRKKSSLFDLFDHSLKERERPPHERLCTFYILHLCCFDGAQRLLIGFSFNLRLIVIFIDAWSLWDGIFRRLKIYREWSFLVWPIKLQNNIMTNHKSHWIQWSWSFRLCFQLMFHQNLSVSQSDDWESIFI